MVKYRPDIDGLRAIAVSAVVAFHAGMPGIGGGFVGVDVFFVISGFLITGLLLTERASTGRIDLPAFWSRRARRLAPAFLLVVLTVLAVAPFALERISGETGALARAAIAAVLINANHFFLSSAGEYFGAAAETNPMLHMWSLSVEEQFYLAWPLLLALLWRSRFEPRGAARWLMLAIIGLSFAAACVLTVVDSKQAFYLMPARAWELVAGGLLALVLHERGSRAVDRRGGALALAGLGLLAASFALQDGQAGFPGPAAAVPVAGTVLLLLGGQLDPGSRISRWLGTRWVVYLGKISYPLYLWHWPVLVLLRSHRLYEHDPLQDLLAVAISLALASATYEFVEKGMWKWFAKRPRLLRAPPPVAFALGGAAVALVLAVGLGAWARYGWAYSVEEARLDAARRDMPPLDCLFQAVPTDAGLAACLGDTRKPTVLLWGDSHANHWRPAAARAAQARGLNLAVLTMNACRPLQGPVGPPDCVAFNARVMREVRQWRGEGGLVGVIASARWPEGAGIPAPSIVDAATWKPGEFFDQRAKSADDALRFLDVGIETLARTLAAGGQRLVVVSPSPVQRFAAVHCLALRAAADCGVQASELHPYVAPTSQVIQAVAVRNPNMRVLDPLSFMCDATACPVVEAGTIVYSDDDHLTRSYSLAQAGAFAGPMAWLASSVRSDGAAGTPRQAATP